MKPRLIVEQKITAFVNKYSVYQASDDGSRGQEVALAQQKRLAFKEKVIFYSDGTRAKIAFTFRAEKVIDVRGRYFVEDANGNLVGMFKKEFGQSLLRSTWSILDKEGAVQFKITESSTILAVLRRFADFIPIVGGLFEIVLLFFRYHFVVLDSSETVHGKYTKTTLFRDHYLLSGDDTLVETVDWRVLAAVSVALDALQSR